jgi:hypothetical protein
MSSKRLNNRNTGSKSAKSRNRTGIVNNKGKFNLGIGRLPVGVNSRLARGDRVVSVPVASEILTMHNDPIINVTKMNTTRVRHREYVQDILGTVPFALATFPINPGVAFSFPWLSSVAQRFEKYHFRELYFDYQARSPSNIQGAIYVSIDYDATDDPPVDKETMLATLSADGPPWASFRFSAGPKNLHSTGDFLFVRSGDQFDSVKSQLNVYDAGQFFVATKDAASGTPIYGELWVAYDVELAVPQLNTIAPAGFQIENTAISDVTHPLTTGVFTTQANDLGAYITPDVIAGDDHITLDKYGTFLGLLAGTGAVNAPALGDIILGETGGHIVTASEEIISPATRQILKLFTVLVNSKNITSDHLSVQLDTLVGGWSDFVATFAPFASGITNILTSPPPPEVSMNAGLHLPLGSTTGACHYHGKH